MAHLTQSADNPGAGLSYGVGDVPFGGAQSVGDVVLDAAATCVHRKGFDNTSLEEIASEAGVSRTTLYRRFGSRESLFKALLIARAGPFRAWSATILLGPGTIQARLETVLTQAIAEMQRVGWLDQSLRDGLSPASIRLFKAAHSESARAGMKPLIEALAGDAARQAGISTEDLVGWMADQMIAIASGPLLEEEDLRKRIRFFIMRVLAPSQPECDIGARLADIEGKIDHLIASRD